MLAHACFYGQVPCLCQFWSNSDMLDPHDKRKRDFGVKFGQNLTFDLSLGGQFLQNLKNACTGLFLWSSSLFVPILVHFGHAGPARQAKNVILGSNLVKIWPLTSACGVNLAKFEKCSYMLVFRVKSLVCANFGPNRTCWTWTIRQKLIFGSNLVKKWPLTSMSGVNFCEISKTPLQDYFYS